MLSTCATASTVLYCVVDRQAGNVVLGKHRRWEVAQVLRDEPVTFAHDRCGKHVPVVGIGHIKLLDDRFVTLDCRQGERIAKHRDQTSSAFGLHGKPFDQCSVCLVEDCCTPPKIEQIGLGQIAEEVADLSVHEHVGVEQNAKATLRVEAEFVGELRELVEFHATASGGPVAEVENVLRSEPAMCADPGGGKLASISEGHHGRARRYEEVGCLTGGDHLWNVGDLDASFAVDCSQDRQDVVELAPAEFQFAVTNAKRACAVCIERSCTAVANGARVRSSPVKTVELIGSTCPGVGPPSDWCLREGVTDMACQGSS